MTNPTQPLPRRADPYRDLLVIDSRAPRFNQAVVAAGSIIAVATGFWPLLGLLGAQLAITLLFGRQFCLACLFYFEVVQPRWGEGPLEDSRAPRFANILGAIFLLTAALAWGLGFVLVGQVLGVMVAALASLAVSTGLCVGCEVYRVLARLRGIKGGALDRIDLEQLGVLPADELVVLFTHPLCSDCQDVGPRLTSAGRRVVTVDVSQRKDLATRYGVTLVPLAVAVRGDGHVLGVVR
ncbi:MAG: DUF4395 family protein [Myxococcota bacterium]